MGTGVQTADGFIKKPHYNMCLLRSVKKKIRKASKNVITEN